MPLSNAKSWKPFLEDELNQPYMLTLKEFLRLEKNDNKVIYPHSSNWFHALEVTPLNEVKVVILGQDPYHNPDQANGLAFSVPKSIKTPPSLLNILHALTLIHATSVSRLIPSRMHIQLMAIQA